MIFKPAGSGPAPMSNQGATLAHPLQAQVVGDTAPATQLIKRTLCVHISGSPANLALAGPMAATWKPAAGKETAVFCPTLDADMDPGTMADSNRNGVIRAVRILQQETNFPFAMGATISCVPPSEVTDLGDMYAYTVLPNSKLSAPQTVYESDPLANENPVWRQNYAQWNTHNLEKEGVIDVPNQPYVFVHMAHPVVGLLRHNADLIGCDIDKQPKIESQYFRVTRQVLATCCQTLRKSILSKMQTQDLNMFSLQLHRLNAAAWDDLGNGAECLQDFKVKAKWTEEQAEREKEHHLRQFVTKQYHYMARLQIEYEVPTTPAVA